MYKEFPSIYRTRSTNYQLELKKKKKLAKVDFAQFPFMACWYSCPKDYCHIIHFSVVHKRLVALEAQNCN